MEEKEYNGISETGSSDYSALASMAEGDNQKEAWYISTGRSLKDGFLKIVLFVLGVVIDVVLTLFKILKVIVLLIPGVIYSIYKGLRWVCRVFRDVDWGGRLSFLIPGFENIRRKQYLDGFVYLIANVALLVFTVTVGVTYIGKVIVLSTDPIYVWNPVLGEWDIGQGENPSVLIYGFFSIFVVIGWIIIYFMSIRGMYDCYRIVHLPDFRAARSDAAYVLDHYDEFTFEGKDGKTLYLEDLSRHKVNKLMRTQMGYTPMSARYISYLDFKKVARDPSVTARAYRDSDRLVACIATAGNPIAKEEAALRIQAEFHVGWKTARSLAKDSIGLYRLSQKEGVAFKEACAKALEDGTYKSSGFAISFHVFQDNLYEKYMGFARWLRSKTWSTPFERYLEPKKPDHEPKRGLEYVKKGYSLQSISFRHTFDKYNDYQSYIRDMRILAGVYGKGQLLYDAIYQRDPVSQRNGLEPHNEGDAIKVKEAVMSIVGAFEVPLEAAKKVASKSLGLLRRLNKDGEEGASVKNRFLAEVADFSVDYERAAAEYETLYKHDALDEALTRQECYRNYRKLRLVYDTGKDAFIGHLTTSIGLTKHDAKGVYRDFKDAIKQTEDDEAKTIALLEKKAERYESSVTEAKSPFHGKVVMAGKRVKQFADEKFAFSVMFLPVAGAVLVCILPLIISIAAGFTNWDRNNQDGYFTWSIEGFANLFGTFSSSGSQSYSYTFVYLLGWTLIWAVFATFTNYIIGIVLALVINRKSIKGKTVFRTMFVLAIAVPQFISLLAVNQLLSLSGPINSFIYSVTGVDNPIKFLSDTANDALLPKVMVIIINIWVGVPYTILSVSGILMNIPEDLYESSRIDGAGPFRQLISITMPYILFVTGPSLLTTFVGNINNFNVIYFLIGAEGLGAGQGGLVASASRTDLLITWLYRMVTGNQKEYNMASIIGMMIFAVCGIISMVVYNRLGSVKNEEAFQ